MKLTKCENGHFYDGDRYQRCPHCAELGAGQNASADYGDDSVTVSGLGLGGDSATVSMSPYGDDSVTVPISQRRDDSVTVPISKRRDDSVTVPISQRRDDTVTVPLREAVQQAVGSPDDEDGKTVSLYQRRRGTDPVTGWLVCIEGGDFGASFTIKSGRNFIGRAEDMDIVLHGDNSVSRVKHAIILYEPKRREFIAQSGDSRELFYLNDEVVLNPVRLKQYDILTIGMTRLMFFPCCGENFSWDDYKKGAF